MLKDLKEKLKKITNQLKTIDWKSWHLPKINFKFDKIFNFISCEYPTTICLFSTHRQSLIELCDRKIEISRGIINE